MAAAKLVLLLFVSCTLRGRALKRGEDDGYDIQTPASGASSDLALLEDSVLSCRRSNNGSMSMIQACGPASKAPSSKVMVSYFKAYEEIHAIAKYQRRKFKDLFVFHAPKTGSSWYYVVWLSACPRLPQKFTRSMKTVWISHDHKGPDVCDTQLYPEVTEHFFYEPKYRRHAVGLFRDPKKRIISEYLWGKKQMLHAGGDVGGAVDKELLLEAIAMKKGGLLHYATAARGVQTRLLLHKEPHERVSDVALTDADVQHAIDIAKNDFAFVGITDDWLISVFRFHAFMGGSAPLYSEFDNVRNTDCDYTEYAAAESELASWEDPYDGPLYEAVKKYIKQDSRQQFQKPCHVLRDSMTDNALCNAMVEHDYIDP